MIEIARITTFATTNRRDIVRRLMACDSFKHLSFADALAQYRYYERAGLVVSGDGYLVVYHNCND